MHSRSDKMQRKRWVSAAVILGLSAGMLPACWPFNPRDDCEQNATLACFWDRLAQASSSDAGGDGGVSIACVPSESSAPIRDDCGVFVSISGDDGADGTQKEPVRSLARAIELAVDAGKPVYACAEEFDAAVQIPNGVTLFGGLDCADGWAYVGEKTKTTIAGGADEIALVLLGGDGTTRLEDVRVIAADAMTPGGSSIAVLADGGNVELARCELAAGNGAHGADGADGDPNGMPATAGVAGSAGENACSDLDGTPGPDAKLLGGDQVTNDCGNDELSIGGSGGNGNVTNGNDGSSGQTGTKGQSGIGEPSMGAWDCDVGGGKIGSSGEVGIAGVGATGLGSLASSGFMGTSGSAGTVGRAGQGGGGGGGAKGGLICAGGVSGSGASGGSGGAGGCGGLPGQGGGSGGASIALVSLSALVTLTDCTLSSTKGGDGGAGGGLQPGGLGGDPGKGGVGAGGSNPACSGGQGGKGGNGGPGGGGLGGPSLGIAFTGTPPSIEGQTSVIPGTPGAGGPGGSVNVAMNAGATGIAGEQQEFP